MNTAWEFAKYVLDRMLGTNNTKKFWGIVFLICFLSLLGTVAFMYYIHEEDITVVKATEKVKPDDKEPN